MRGRLGITAGYEGLEPRQVGIREADVPRMLTHLSEGAAPVPAPVDADPPDEQ